MMLSLLLLFIALFEPVNLQGDVKQLILKGQKQPCEGQVQVYYNNQWGFVGDTKWDEKTEEVVCRSTHCGKPVKNSTGITFRPIDSKVWLNELGCKGSEGHLWECENPGWGISEYRPDTVKTIKCSRKIEISLDGYKCAGAVRFTTGDGTTPGYFCDQNWATKEANLLCSSLNCGESKEIVKQRWFGWKDFPKSNKMEIKCAGISNLNNLWHCANQESATCQNPAAVICTGFQRLQLRGNGSNACSGRLEQEEGDTWNPVREESSPDAWCKQMQCGTFRDKNVSGDGINVACSDKVKVVLKDGNKESRCYGAVHIEVNGTSRSVCGSGWTEKEAGIVCREKGCGRLLKTTPRSKFINNGIMDNVRCSGSESSLWHCLAKRDIEPFQCNSNVYVVCADSVDVRLVDAPGSCAGRVEVKYEGKWQRVDKKSWTDSNSNTVCRQLQCGEKRQNSDSEEKFSQGSGDFLPVAIQCKQSASKIADCMKKDPVSSVGTREAVGITCEKDKVVFLQKSCSGMVGIEHNEKTYWLSGSNETWNQSLANTVCRQMSCGEASSINSTPREKKKEIWQESYKCLSNSTSLFQCDNVTQPSDHNDSIATVNCTGKFQVSLTKTCWGNVNVCTGGKCGGVCSDSWTSKKADMLCKSLGCGRAVPTNQFQGSERSNIAMFKSLHTTKQTTDLNQCNFISQSKDKTACEQMTAYVVCSDSIKTQIKATRDKCMGNVEVLHEGQYLPVCKEALAAQETRNIICMEQGCGDAVNLIDTFGPETQSSHISNIQCAADKKLLNECDIKLADTTCSLAGLQCSGYRKMELISEEACSGPLFVYPGGKRSAVSVEGWTETEGRRLCQDLKCGSFGYKKSIEPEITDDFWNSSFSCKSVTDNPQSIWECEKPSTAPQTKQLFIHCEGAPNVTLSGKCGGEVKIDNIGVCDTNWNIDYSHLVCQEMGCSNAVAHSSKEVSILSSKEYHHVQCEQYHSKLGQCKRFKAKCNRLVSVHCVKNVKFNTTQKCGGQIQVDYRNQWENLCVVGSLQEKFKTQVCEKLDCERQNTSSHIPNSQQVRLKTPLKCTEAHEDIAYCITQGSCEGNKLAEVYCKGRAANHSSVKRLLPFLLQNHTMDRQ
ncbi:scavenger receptor cysteine-rich type 1 protein M130 isoform X2 [Halichoeres trimaculatus]|uniref:scavenger receptor cysteine-rich type 1 protein M130 isoform X2 n=1 Tax=Halichoeres trimaculatus TaxID=147232 RepID=UPI003D9F5886